MSQKAMTLKSISELAVKTFLATAEETTTRKMGQITNLSTYGRLAIDRPASVRVVKDGEMLSVRLNVSGGGELSTGFTIFADEATPERIERYLNHYAGIHRTASEKWVAWVAEGGYLNIYP